MDTTDNTLQFHTVTIECPLCGAQSTARHYQTVVARGVAELGQRYHLVLAHGEQEGN
jgi:hypothetical protein